MRFRRGFTLLELLAVIAIIGVLVVISLPGLNNLRQTSNLKDTTDVFVSAVRNEQALAIAGQGNTNHQISITATTYTTSSATTSWSGLTVTPPTPSTITFKKLTGVALDSAGNQMTSDQIISIGNGSKTYQVHIKPLGVVTIQ